jgi:prophage antirepressor-like protein
MKNIQNKEQHLVVSAGVTVNLLPDDKHEFLITAQDMAKGYNVPAATIWDCVRCHAVEFEEGKHFLTHPEDDNLMWTKRGVVRLGFFIDGPKARIFRDMIEDLKLLATPESSDTFTFGDNHPVRVIMIEKEPWFVGKDVACILGYKNTKDALIKHVDEDDRMLIQLSDIQEGRDLRPHMKGSKIQVITESGVYSLIFGSNLPRAKEFKHWVTSKVLPAIRKTGKYTPETVENDCPYTRDLAEPRQQTSTMQLLEVMYSICKIENAGVRSCLADKLMEAMQNVDVA